MSHQAFTSDIIQNSAVGIFSPTSEGTKAKSARVLISWLPRKFRSLYFAHLATLKNPAIVQLITFLKTPQTLNLK
jgi:hypothetical protein